MPALTTSRKAWSGHAQSNFVVSARHGMHFAIPEWSDGKIKSEMRGHSNRRFCAP
jgi:hypothetical protein